MVAAAGFFADIVMHIGFQLGLPAVTASVHGKIRYSAEFAFAVCTAAEVLRLVGIESEICQFAASVDVGE